MSTERLDSLRRSVLTQMERAERNMRLGIFGAAVAELALFVIALRLVDMDNRLERLMFVLAVLSYTIIVLGLVALGAHVTRATGRVIAAMDASRSP